MSKRRYRPECTDHVRAYDFVADRTHDGKPLRMLTVVDKYSRECLAIVPARTLCSDDVIEALADLFMERGAPEYLRSDNGLESGPFTGRGSGCRGGRPFAKRPNAPVRRGLDASTLPVSGISQSEGLPEGGEIGRQHCLVHIG